IGQLEVSFTIDGKLTLGSGASIETVDDLQPLFDHGYPISTSDTDPSTYGGVFIRAGDVDLQGDITSRYGAAPGDISIEIANSATSAIVGGARSGQGAGSFNLSNATFQHLHGDRVTVPSAT